MAKFSIQILIYHILYTNLVRYYTKIFLKIKRIIKKISNTRRSYLHKSCKSCQKRFSNTRMFDNISLVDGYRRDNQAGKEGNSESYA